MPEAGLQQKGSAAPGEGRECFLSPFIQSLWHSEMTAGCGGRGLRQNHSDNIAAGFVRPS